MPTKREKAPEKKAADSKAVEGNDKGKPTKRAQKSPVALIVILVVIALILIACSVFSWMRWGRFDDAADIQGEWRIDGTEIAIAITDTQLRLTKDAIYTYRLDTYAKTIEFNLNDLSGEGRYRFSDDRHTLIIMDGGDCSWMATLIADTKLQVARWWASLTNGDVPPLAEGDNATTLVRMGVEQDTPPDDAAAAEGDAGEGGESGDGTTAEGSSDEAGGGEGAGADGTEGATSAEGDSTVMAVTLS